MGIVFAIMAGILICIQGAFNSRVGAKAGLWETTVIVHAVGLVASLAIMFLAGAGDLRKITQVNILYLIGGAFGAIIVYSYMKSISLMGMSFATAIILIAQLLASSAVDHFGLFDAPVIRFDGTKLLGLAVMAAGIVIFKLKG